MFPMKLFICNVIYLKRLMSFSKNIRTTSGLFPLHEALIISSNGEKILIKRTPSKLDSNYVFRMTSETCWCVANSAWISEELNKTVVISCSDQALIFTKIDSVDVSTIGAFWEDTIDEPTKFGVTRSPVGSCGI